MTAEERKIIADRIETKISRLKEKIEHFEDMAAPVSPENSIGRISRMDAINNKAVAEAALREARKELHELEYAQGRVDKPDFGECAKCHGEINVKRLMLMPGSKYCTRCAS